MHKIVSFPLLSSFVRAIYMKLMGNLWCIIFRCWNLHQDCLTWVQKSKTNVWPPEKWVEAFCKKTLIEFSVSLWVRCIFMQFWKTSFHYLKQVYGKKRHRNNYSKAFHLSLLYCRFICLYHHWVWNCETIQEVSFKFVFELMLI